MAKCKYERFVKPHLDEIKKWTGTYTERQIADKLSIGYRSFCRYKNQYPELAQILDDGKKKLVKELKDTLKKKAKGFYYEETKIIKIHNPDEEAETEWIERIEVNRKYAQPDTGAAHLLLKNLDPDWRNDDKQTMDLKRKQVEIQQQKADQDNW